MSFSVFIQLSRFLYGHIESGRSKEGSPSLIKTYPASYDGYGIYPELQIGASNLAQSKEVSYLNCLAKLTNVDLLCIELRKAGFSYSDLAKLSLSALPFSLKIFPAVVCDSVFISKLGRRRTWVIIGHLIIASSLTLFHIYLDKWIESKTITPIAFTMGIMYLGSVRLSTFFRTFET